MCSTLLPDLCGIPFGGGGGRTEEGKISRGNSSYVLNLYKISRGCLLRYQILGGVELLHAAV